MPDYTSYVICGTPRSGSTLLCEMLAASSVAGRPNSYFRQESIEHWADRWSVDRSGGIEDAAFDQRYLAAMVDYGGNGTGIFGLRLMWASMSEASRRLARVQGGAADITEQFETAFGPTLYIQLSRNDKVAQAISLVRAEQSGLWHLAADGSVFEGVATPRPNVYDADRLGAVFTELNSDDAAWEALFVSQQIAPVRLTYESMTADPQAALAQILTALGRDPGIAKTLTVGTAKMANSTSLAWAAQFRADNGLPASA